MDRHVSVPKIRDNVIRRLGTFDVEELSLDVTGDVQVILKDEGQHMNDGIINPTQSFSPGWDYRKWECPTTAGRNCFIFWGDPWDSDAWETTPGFLKKWPWIVAGCPEIIRATNKWREMRGEEPIVMELE